MPKIQILRNKMQEVRGIGLYPSVTTERVRAGKAMAMFALEKPSFNIVPWIVLLVFLIILVILH